MCFEKLEKKSKKSLRVHKNIFIKNQIQGFPSHIVGFQIKNKKEEKNLTFFLLFN